MRKVLRRETTTWQFTLNDNQIYEANIGCDPHNLYFPAVSSCTILVFLTNQDNLIGGHFDKDITIFQMYYLLQGMADMKGAQTVRKMAVMGNFSWAGSPESYTRKPEFGPIRSKSTFAEAFDYTGNVLYYDQGMLANKHYRAQAAGGGNWAIYSADVTYLSVKGTKSPNTFDPRRTIWLQQALEG